MKHSVITFCRCITAVAVLLTARGSVFAEDIALDEERAIQAAAAHVAPSVVHVETIGGLQRKDGVVFDAGPTTGVIISGDGYIVVSAAGLAHQPNSIVIRTADGSRAAARKLATDYSRSLVLLKIEPSKRFTPPVAAPIDSLRTGAWAIAVGRTFDVDKVNLSVGVVSGLNRIWGRAVQTDAKISPANYGGPLVDIRGRVIGVLTPLSPSATGPLAGADWYDSGIGFAVPLEHIKRILPRWTKGDLHKGILGISMSRGGPFAKPEIAAVRAGSPADKAGLKTDDRFVRIDGRQTRTQDDLKLALGPHYAGDTVKIVIARGEKQLEHEVTLVEKLPPYQQPFLGLLPMRDADEDDPKLLVRLVYPNSPAAEAGVKTGDQIVSIEGEETDDRASALRELRMIAPGQEISLRVRRDGKQLNLTATLATPPELVPDVLPAARAEAAEQSEDRPPVGTIEPKLPEFKNKAAAYIPTAYHSEAACGVLVWLHAPGGPSGKKMIERFKPFCDRHNFVLLAPRSADPKRWQRDETAVVAGLLRQLATKYTIDPTRIVVAGRQGGGGMAYLTAFGLRDVIRGVATISSPMPRAATPPATDPVRSLSFYSASSKLSPQSPRIEADVKRLRAMKHPVVTRERPAAAKLTDEELSELVRWSDSLDRF